MITSTQPFQLKQLISVPRKVCLVSMAKGKSFKAILKRMLKIESAVSLLEDRRAYVRVRTSEDDAPPCKPSSSKDVNKQVGFSGSEDFQMFSPWDHDDPWNHVASDGEVSPAEENERARQDISEASDEPLPAAQPCGDCSFLEAYVIDLEQAKLDLQVQVRDLREGLFLEGERAASCEEHEERYRKIAEEKEALHEAAKLEASRLGQQLSECIEHMNEQAIKVRKLNECISHMCEEHEKAIFRAAEESNHLSDCLEEAKERLKWALSADNERPVKYEDRWYSA